MNFSPQSSVEAFLQLKKLALAKMTDLNKKRGAGEHCLNAR
jgi:hypothetical protein